MDASSCSCCILDDRSTGTISQHNLPLPEHRLAGPVIFGVGVYQCNTDKVVAAVRLRLNFSVGTPSTHCHCLLGHPLPLLVVLSHTSSETLKHHVVFFSSMRFVFSGCAYFSAFLSSYCWRFFDMHPIGLIHVSDVSLLLPCYCLSGYVSLTPYWHDLSCSELFGILSKN